MKGSKFKPWLAYLLIFSVISSVVAYNNMTARRLDSVDPKIKEFFQPYHKEMEKKFPQYKIEVISGTRTFEHQNQLFKKGITPAKGGQSYHNFGEAIDIAPFKNGKPVFNDYKFWKENTKVVQKYGMESGGTWKKKDYVHIQIPRNVYPISKMKKDFAKGGFGEVFFNAEQHLAEAKRKRGIPSPNASASSKGKTSSSNCCCKVC